MHRIKTKSVELQAILWDGTMDVFTELERWAAANDGELYYIEPSLVFADRKLMLYSRIDGTTHLRDDDVWVVLNEQGGFDVYDQDDFHERFEVL